MSGLRGPELDGGLHSPILPGVNWRGGFGDEKGGENVSDDVHRRKHFGSRRFGI